MLIIAAPAASFMVGVSAFLSATFDSFLEGAAFAGAFAAAAGDFFADNRGERRADGVGEVDARAIGFAVCVGR